MTQHNADPNLLVMMGRIDGKLDAALHRMGKTEEDIESLKSKVSSLEKEQTTRKGVLIGLSVSGGLASSALFQGILRAFGG